MEILRRGTENRNQLKNLILNSEEFDESYVEAVYKNILLVVQEALDRVEVAQADWRRYHVKTNCVRRP